MARYGECQHRTKYQVRHFIWALLSPFCQIPFQMKGATGKAEDISRSSEYVAPDLSSTGIITHTSHRKMQRGPARIEQMYIPACPVTAIVCSPLLSRSTVAPSKPSTRKLTKRAQVKVKVSDWAGETVLGLKHGQSLTVDLHRAQPAFQTVNEFKYRKALEAEIFFLR